MSSQQQLLDFAVITIFARETLEGGIILGEYRTIILRSDANRIVRSNNTASNDDDVAEDDDGTSAARTEIVSQKEALRAVTVSALVAAFVAVVVCAAIAIPLAILSQDFDNRTAKLIEGISKIVAAICLLQLSLKMPKFFGLYYSKAQVRKRKQRRMNEEDEARDDDGEDNEKITLRSIRFNVAWNIWREVAECGVFLIPFFLTGDGVAAIPLSAVVGFLCGAAVCLLIYYANKHFRSTVGLATFTSGLLLLLSTGLFSGGCHNIEEIVSL
ncbi:MAG: hypothetical protein SGARI_002636 [Bacillariaceae sp.]